MIEEERTVTTGTWIATFSLNIFLSVTFFALFVAAFFFVVASRIEVVAVENNTGRVVSELMVDITKLVDTNERASIKSALTEHLKPPDMSAKDKEVADSNRALLRDTWIVLGSAFAAGLVIVFLVWGFMKWRAGPNGRSGFDYPDLRHLFVENLILLGFVGLTEFAFLLVVGAHYRSLDANKIRRNALGTMRAFVLNK